MSELAKEISRITIEQELKHSYLDYAMSVIVGRALPDVRDGLKPVHRRVLFAMNELGNDWNKAHKKSARIVGDVIGKYHPHGESAVYDTIVRMAQPFTMRYMLVDGQGNFGSVDGDAPAAMRYTEIRLSRFAHAMLADLDKETVDFLPNYDGSESAPVVLPTQVPNLLVNGSAGIAVGMATNIPPHNLGEVIDACLALLSHPEITVDQLLQYLPGPDFPTAGIINGRAGIIEAYRTGRGRVVMRGRTQIEEMDSQKQAIIINELPYQVNKAKLIERIAELVKEKKIEGITGLRDESDKDGMRVVIELRRGENADVVINNLFTHTPLQTAFNVNMVALVDGQPRTLNLKEVLAAFLKHRREVITRRTIFELRKARERAHVLEGLGVALVNIDAIIQLIKSSQTPAEAKEKLLALTWQPGLVAKMLERIGSNLCRPENVSVEYGLHDNIYRLSPEQVQAILDLRLHRLTNLEQDKILQEYEVLCKEIQNCLAILSDSLKLLAVMQEELTQVKQQFADPRRTEILAAEQDLTVEDLIDEEMLIITLSRQGYAKSQPVSAYAAQHRGGKGKVAAAVKEEDVIQTLLVAHSHDTMLCFSSLGKVYWLKAYQFPQASRISRGRPIINLLPLSNEERITAILPVCDFCDDHFIFMATKKGTVKKVVLSDFAKPRSQGLIAVGLQDDDELIGVAITHGSTEIMLFSDGGRVVRFNETAVRAMGRNAQGVRGMKLNKDQNVISLVIPDPAATILTATENGYGKCTELSEYRLTHRGTQGVISIPTNKRNGKVVAALPVTNEDEVLLLTDRGTVVRTRVAEISCVGRQAQGVRLIQLNEEEKLVAVKRVEELDESETEAS